jgi:hypothetical protein
LKELAKMEASRKKLAKVNEGRSKRGTVGVTVEKEKGKWRRKVTPCLFS